MLARTGSYGNGAEHRVQVMRCLMQFHVDKVDQSVNIRLLRHDRMMMNMPKLGKSTLILSYKGAACNVQCSLK